jgi:plastocyanin
VTTRLVSGLAVGFVLVFATACGGTEPDPTGAPPRASRATAVAGASALPAASSIDSAGLDCTKPAAAGDPAISITAHKFPAITTITAGQTVSWTNDDTLNHTVTFRNGGPDCGVLLIHDSVSVTFNETGTYDYFCRFHQVIMQAKIVVE